MNVDSRESPPTIESQQGEVIKYVLVIDNTIKTIEVLENLLKQQRADYHHYNTILLMHQHKLDQLKREQEQ